MAERSVNFTPDQAQRRAALRVSASMGRLPVPSPRALPWYAVKQQDKAEEMQRSWLREVLTAAPPPQNLRPKVEAVRLPGQAEGELALAVERHQAVLNRLRRFALLSANIPPGPPQAGDSGGDAREWRQTNLGERRVLFAQLLLALRVAMTLVVEAVVRGPLSPLFCT